MRGQAHSRHLRTVDLRLVVPGADAIDFYARAFGAERLGDVFSGPDGAPDVIDEVSPEEIERRAARFFS